MGSSMWSYEGMVRETDRIFTHSKKVDEDTSLKDLELRIKSYEHDGEFFFKCGIAAANILNDICVNGGCNDMNDSIGGLSMFRKLIGTENTQFKPSIDKYKWHDLREDPNDLPEMDCEYQDVKFSVVVLIISESSDNPITAFADLATKIWYNLSDDDHFENALEDAIAWKYIEPFEKSVSSE